MQQILIEIQNTFKPYLCLQHIVHICSSIYFHLYTYLALTICLNINKLGGGGAKLNGGRGGGVAKLNGGRGGGANARDTLKQLNEIALLKHFNLHLILFFDEYFGVQK